MVKIKTQQNLENSPLESSLSHDDIPLLQIALDCGADPNENRGICGSTLEQCLSVDVAKLLLHYGADFDRQHQEKDLIRPLCCGTSTDSDDKLLPLFLSYVTLNATNRFGQEWIKPLARFASCFHYANFSERLSILLRHGCHYNQEDQDKIIESINKTTLWSVSTEEEKQEKRQEIGNLFDQDKKRRTNIVIGLQNRARTGKSLIRNTNLSACYNRAFEMKQPKKKEYPVAYSPKWHIFPKIEMLSPFNNHL
jgi:hypothetical protein